jgi:DNA (cytosine-5)-methyltransferase 1
MRVQMVKPKVISTFAGCGGSSLGYRMAGYQELLAVEWDEKAAHTFSNNFPEVPVWVRDINNITGAEIMDFCKIGKGELDVFDGSPPCQGFSTLGKRKPGDNRNILFKQFTRLINELSPKAFVMENVAGMLRGIMKGQFIEIMTELKKLDYNVKCKRLNAMWYGVPQSRNRLIFIGIRKDLDIMPQFPEAVTDRPLTVKDAIGDLLDKPQDESINHVWVDEATKETETYLYALNIKQGQKYRGFQKRYDWNKPGGTNVAGGSVPIKAMLRNFGAHPLLTRTYSIREYARLQSFPDEFKFPNDLIYGFKQIGNSVPPLMMKAIAGKVKQQLLNDVA